MPLVNPAAGTKSAGPSPEASKPKTRKDYVASFAETVTRFTAKDSSEQVLTQVPELLVKHFDVARAELWLWDESSSSAYITHAAGIE